MLSVDDIKPYVKNAKKHPKKQIDALGRIVKKVGWRQPILVNSKGVIVAGHGRWETWLKFKDEVKPVWIIDDVGNTVHGEPENTPLSEQDEKAYRLADNKLAESDYDMGLVVEEGKDLVMAGYDFSLTGFDNDLLIEVDEKDDIVPDVPDEPKAKLGDVYQLGDHRLMCGDSTKLEDVEKLMDGHKASMVFTDPPYLMAFEGGINEKGEKSVSAKTHGVIQNDALNREEGDEFLLGFCINIRLFCRGAWYITFYRLGMDRLFNALERANLKYRNVVIWKKNNHNLSNSDYKSLYEPMIIGWSDEYVPVFYGWNDVHNWNGKKNEKDVWEVNVPSIWEVDKTKKNDLHPTMKPVELVSRAILNSSKRGQIIMDIFLGGGSTLIAAEKTGRICYGMELDPNYVDVIIKRWEDYTGEKAIKL